jgi:hypothetical protein
VSFLAHAFELVVVAGAVTLLAAVAAFFLARRYVRRRWRTVRAHVATRGVLASLSIVASWREWFGGRATPEDLSRGPAARVRRRMWVAVEDAEAAVQHADSVDAPIAELPAVCRSLRHAADELDALLRLERRLPAGPERPEAVRSQVAELIQASRDVQLAALRAGSDATEPQVRALVRDARDEVDIVAAALTRLRSVTPRPH